MSLPLAHRDPPLQPRHWLRGFLALAIALGAAVALPASAQRIWPTGQATTPPVAPGALPAGTTLRSIAPESVEAFPGTGGVIFAGLPQPPADDEPKVMTPGSTITDSGTPHEDPGEQAPQRQISAPDMKRAWLSTQLPKEVPRQDYSGWVAITATENGKVTAAKITTSSGDPVVDKETLARLERETLDPAVETLADGTRVPVAYEGQWFFRWILLRAE